MTKLPNAPFHIVLCDWNGCRDRKPYFTEVDCGMTFEEVVKDATDGQFTDVLAIYCIDPVRGTSEDVTKAVCERVRDAYAAADERMPRDMKRLCSQHELEVPLCSEEIAEERSYQRSLRRAA